MVVVRFLRPMVDDSRRGCVELGCERQGDELDDGYRDQTDGCILEDLVHLELLPCKCIGGDECRSDVGIHDRHGRPNC